MPLSASVLWLLTRMQAGTRRMRRHAFLELVMPSQVLASEDKDALAERLVEFFGHDLAEQPPIVNQQIAAMRAYDATSRLATLADVPTLVVSAEHDKVAPPRLGQALAHGIPGARYVEVAGAAHGVTIHDAEQVNSLLLTHFASVDSRVEAILS